MQAHTTDQQQCLVLGMGGTIAGRASAATDNVGYTAGALSVDALVAGIPVPDGLQLQAEQVVSLDSKDMEGVAWQRLVQRLCRALSDPAVDSVLITHGTDTLEETAYLVQVLLRPGKPVVFTCAMRPATALMADGPQNLVDALSVAQAGRAGVWVVCAGHVHDAMSVQKVHGYRVDAFDSGEWGVAGRVEEGRVMWHRAPRAVWPQQVVDVTTWLETDVADWPKVGVLMSHADAQPWEVDAVVTAGAQGVVLMGTGNGTWHQAWAPSLQRASQNGVMVWRSSRCGSGWVVEGASSGAWTVAQGLNPAKARLALQLSLMAAGGA